jgi:hypothetical protein
MKNRLILAWVLCVVALMYGCMTGLTATRRTPDAKGSKAKSARANAGAAQQMPKPGDKAVEAALPPPPPGYKPPDSSEAKAMAEGAVDPVMRAEVNEAALRFAKEIPNVKHIKTCFSKLYGGWYLLLYAQKGKKLLESHWAWNPKTKEWEPVSLNKEVPKKILDYYLKGEVGGEKCSVLK